MDEDIVVADTNNHRVQVFEKMGGFKYHFGIPGTPEIQNSPFITNKKKSTCFYGAIKLEYCMCTFSYIVCT